MSDDARQATPHAQLIAALLDPRVQKTEREHAAAREIERLRNRLEVAPHHRIDGIAARDATIREQDKEIERLRAERDEARAERDAMAKDAARYRFLSCKGVPPHSHRWSRWRLEYWNGEWWDPLMKEELDAAIDTQIEKERGND